MNYTLYNKRLGRNLDHPRVGLWFTTDLREAQEMLQACKEYLAATNLRQLTDDFVIREVETGEEIVGA